MLLTSLLSIPNRSFYVLGLVYATASLHTMAGGNVQKMVQTLTQQATQLGADGIIDIKVVGAGEGYFVMTGTALKLA